MEHRRNPGVIRGVGGFLLDHRRENHGLIHAQRGLILLHLVAIALRVGVILGVIRVEHVVNHVVFLGQQLVDDALGRGREEDAVGVRGEIALQRVLAAGQRARVLRRAQCVGRAHKAIHVVAKREELAAIVDGADAHQIVGDVLTRPSGNDGHHALVVLAARGQLGNDLIHRHARRELVGAVAQGVGQALELNQIAEHLVAAQKTCVLEVLADLRHGRAALDLEVHHVGVHGVRRREEHAVDLVVAHRDHAHHDQHAAKEDQHRPKDFPQPRVPEQAVLALLMQRAGAVSLQRIGFSLFSAPAAQPSVAPSHSNLLMIDHP